MTEKSRKNHQENIKKNCGTCIHKNVCQYKGTYNSAVSRIIHEAQADENLVELKIKCVHHSDKYGTSERFD